MAWLLKVVPALVLSALAVAVAKPIVVDVEYGHEPAHSYVSVSTPIYIRHSSPYFRAPSYPRAQSYPQQAQSHSHVPSYPQQAQSYSHVPSYPQQAQTYSRVPSYPQALSLAPPPPSIQQSPIIGSTLSYGHALAEPEPTARPKYAFKYGVEAKHTGDYKDAHEERDGDEVRGHYSLLEADGRRRTVHYTASKHGGFNAVVSYSGGASTSYY